MDEAVSETGSRVREQPIPPSVVSWLSQFCHHHVPSHGGVRAGANSANASSGQGSRLLCGCFSMRVCARVGLSAGFPFETSLDPEVGCGTGSLRSGVNCSTIGVISDAEVRTPSHSHPHIAISALHVRVLLCVGETGVQVHDFSTFGQFKRTV